MIHITSPSEFHHAVVLASYNAPVLVDFWATWCGPCKAITPLLAELARQYPRLTIAKVDIEGGASSVAAALQINTVPTLIVYKGGVPVARSYGHPGSVTALRQFLAAYL